MRIYYPRSFSGLLCLAFALIALPLMVALVNNAVSIDRLVNRSQLAVYQAVWATQNSRRLSELLTALERSARQMLILGDRSLLDTYVTNRKQFLEAVATFTVPPFDSTQMAVLDEIVRGEAAVYAMLSKTKNDTSELPRVAQQFSELSDRSRVITQHSNEMIDRETGAMRAAATRAQRIIFWQLLALLPVVVFLAVGFAILITRPIRQLDAAIRRLGSGEFHTPVAVTGPVDLEYLGERLEWMRNKLLEVEEQKNRFLRQVSHELKTPLTALREGAELLAEGAVGTLSSEQHEVTEILQHQSLKLQKLIEDLLTYNAGHFNSSALELTTVNIRELINRVAEDQKLALRARDLTLDVHAEDAVLTGDGEKLKDMLDNLLSNAVKFSPVGGTIVINVKQDGNQVEIKVADSGPGIAAEDRPHVFEPFYQGRVTANSLVKGTGIGLSLVRDCAKAHGGNVEITDDDRAAGTCLCVRLPLRPQRVPA